MNKNGVIGLIVIIILIVIVIVGYNMYSSPNTTSEYGQQNGTGVGASPTPIDVGSINTPTPSGSPVQTTGQTKTFNITGSNFKFSQTNIAVNKGDKVRIVFTSSGGNHDFVLDEFNVRTAVLGTGEQQTVEFIADKTGSFQYYCSVPTHRQMGMVGTLTVK